MTGFHSLHLIFPYTHNKIQIQTQIIKPKALNNFINQNKICHFLYINQICCKYLKLYVNIRQ